jgi:hypothetical protein
MIPLTVIIIRVVLITAILIIGWWLAFRPDTINKYFGNPVFSRTPLMASLNRTHSIFFGWALMAFAVISAYKGIAYLISHAPTTN